MHSIGALSKLVGVSADALRYYDEIDLLKPARVAADTGYRYYSDEQIKTIAQIQELKAYGFTLARIKQILSSDELSRSDVYQTRYIELMREHRRLQTVMNKLSRKLLRKQEGMHMQRTVLLVDDAAFMRLMQKDILTKNGYIIVGEADNGIKAIELYKSLAPDIVVMDITMPEMNGITAMEKIFEYDKDAVVVMCSAMGQIGLVAESLLLGAQDFVVKPFQAERLIETMNATIGTIKTYDRTAMQKTMDEWPGNPRDILSQREIDTIMSLTRVVAYTTPKATTPNDTSDNAKTVGRPIQCETTEEIMLRLAADVGLVEKAPTDTDNAAKTANILRLLERIAQSQETTHALLRQIIEIMR